MLTASGISKIYKDKIVLDGVGLSLLAGQAAVIVGRNGSGKSTLLSILCGFLRADSGEIDRPQSLLGYCPQVNNLFEELTVRDNLAFWRASSGGVDDDSRMLARILGVDDFVGKRVAHLSVGMKKSVAICCAVCGNPDLLVFDEPFAGLDIFHKSALLDAFSQLTQRGKAILYSSHSVDEIFGAGADIYILSDRKLARYVHEDGRDMLKALTERL